MASVDVKSLSQQEVAQLACSYAALILHDDGQDVTGTPLMTQPTSSRASSKLPMSRLRPTGPSTLPRHSRERTLAHS